MWRTGLGLTMTMTMTASLSILISKHTHTQPRPTTNNYKTESIKQIQVLGVVVIKRKNALHISSNSIYHLRIRSEGASTLLESKN